MTRMLEPHHELNIALSEDKATPVLTVDGERLPADEMVSIPAGALALWIVGVIRLAVDQSEKPKAGVN